MIHNDAKLSFSTKLDPKRKDMRANHIQKIQIGIKQYFIFLNKLMKRFFEEFSKIPGLEKIVITGDDPYGLSKKLNDFFNKLRKDIMMDQHFIEFLNEDKETIFIHIYNSIMQRLYPK